MACDPNILNSMYYTFSTLAQSVAGLLGFTGALVIFRLQQIQSKIDFIIESSQSRNDTQYSFEGIFQNSKNKNLIAQKHLREFFQHYNAKPQLQARVLPELETVLQNRVNLISQVKKLSITSFILFVFSIVILSSGSNFICDDRYLGIFTLGIFFSGLILFFTYKTINTFIN